MIQKSIPLSICIFFTIISLAKSEYFGKFCTFTEDCESEKILMECQDGKCSCYTSDIYNEITKNVKLGLEPKNPCVGNATCHISRCQCNVGFKATINETCIEMTPEEILEHNTTQGYLGKICNYHSHCENSKIQLFCKANNTCGCSVLDNYDPVSQMCRVRPGYSCSFHRYPCVENASCIGSICKCDPGYKESIEEICIKNTEIDINDINTETGQIFETPGYFGKPCSWNKDCESNSNLLLCHDDGFCKCTLWGHYDETSNLCRARAGQLCLIPTNPCIKNANCIDADGKCKCKPGFRQVNELCEPLTTSHPNSVTDHLSEPNAFQRLVLNDTIYVHHTHDYPQGQSLGQSNDMGWIIAFIFLLGSVTLTLGYLLLRKYQNNFVPSISYKRHVNPECSYSNNIHISDKY